MPRDVRKPRSGWDDQDEPIRLSLTVYDDEPEPTGLLDQDGTELYRVPDQIGFVRAREETD